jgi:hypothetical protein
MDKKATSKWIKILILVAIVCIIYFLIPCPEGLQAVDKAGVPTANRELPGSCFQFMLRSSSA